MSPTLTQYCQRSKRISSLDAGLSKTEKSNMVQQSKPADATVKLQSVGDWGWRWVHRNGGGGAGKGEPALAPLLARRGGSPARFCSRLLAVVRESPALLCLWRVFPLAGFRACWLRGNCAPAIVQPIPKPIALPLWERRGGRKLDVLIELRKT